LGTQNHGCRVRSARIRTMKAELIAHFLLDQSPSENSFSRAETCEERKIDLLLHKASVQHRKSGNGLQRDERAGRKLPCLIALVEPAAKPLEE
jgi:hypothetical protein